MRIGGCGNGGNRALSNKVVPEEATGNNCGVCYREADLRTMY